MHMCDPDHRKPLPTRPAIELFGTILAQTPKAWRFAPEDDRIRACWLPKSRAAWNGVTMTMPEWLARDRGLITELPDDNPAWEVVAYLPRPPYFRATAIARTDPAGKVVPFPRRPRQPSCATSPPC